MLDLFYANVRDTYSSSTQPALGKADHNLVYLSSTYKSIVQRQPVTKRTVRRWSQDAKETLWGCFEATDWDGLWEPHGDDINAMTECVTDYVNIYVDNTRTVTRFSNNKPWSKVKIRDNKEVHRRKLENRLQQNNV